MHFLDAHCHLEHPQFEKDIGQVIARAKKANVKAITCGSSHATNLKTLEIAGKHPETIKPALGLSPFDAVKEKPDATLKLIEENKDKIACIAEIGLDFHYFKAEDEKQLQRAAFQKQLELAEKLGLPVEIHTRDAEHEVLDIIESFKCAKILHCWMKPKLTEKALDQGCFLSVPTAKSRDKLKVIENTPMEKLLCETDSPFLWQGRNEPANVVSVYQAIADAKKIGLNEVQRVIYANSQMLFGDEKW